MTDRGLMRPAGPGSWPVARAVGYSSPYALSAAFKRVRGTSPHQHRTAQRSAAASD